ncbi:MAG: tetratricopeptide repeat protein [Nitrospira sp.]|nr:tetratricopeptide repeat protein [Nitrospira sp.]
MAVGNACHILIALLVAWVLWPAPDARAGVIVPIEPQGMFDFAGTAEKAITYANAYLKRQAAEGPAGQELRLQWSSQAALDNLERQLQKTPEDLELQTALGVALFGVSRPKEAQRLFEQSARANPSYAIGHCYLAYLALLEDDRSGFGRHFQQAIQADPTYVPAYNSLAIFYNKIGNTDAALRILTQGIARFPNEASFFYNQAIIHGSQENWEAAQVSFQHAVTRQPTEQHRLVLGTILLKRHQYERAQTVFESILDTNPKHVVALAGLADSYKGRHDFVKAIALIERAIAIDPHNADLHDELRIHKEASEKWERQAKEN